MLTLAKAVTVEGTERIQVGHVLEVQSAGFIDQVPGQGKKKLGITSRFWPE